MPLCDIYDSENEIQRGAARALLFPTPVQSLSVLGTETVYYKETGHGWFWFKNIWVILVFKGSWSAVG